MVRATMALPLETLKERTAGDALLARFGRDFDCALLVGDGDTDWLIEIARGEVARVTKGPFIMPRTDLRLRAASETWTSFLRPVRLPGYPALLAFPRSRPSRMRAASAWCPRYPFSLNPPFPLRRP